MEETSDSVYPCGICTDRLSFRDLISHIVRHIFNPYYHSHELWCHVCASTLNRGEIMEQRGNHFESDMREVSDRTYLPAGVYYNPSNNFVCETDEWHNDAYYGYNSTPTYEYIPAVPTVPMCGYSLDNTGLLQLNNIQSNFNSIPFPAATHANLPMLNYVVPHVDVAYTESPLEAINNESVESEIPNFEGAESRSELTSGEIPTTGSACAESRLELTNGKKPTTDSEIAEYWPTIEDFVWTGSPSEATKQELPCTEDATGAESPSESTNEKMTTIKDTAYTELRSDAINEIPCVKVVTYTKSRSEASYDMPSVENSTYVEPQTVVLKPEIVSKYKDDRPVVADLNEFRVSEYDNIFQKDENSDPPQIENTSINHKGSHYKHFQVSASNSRQDQRGRGLCVSSNTNRNSNSNNRNGYRNAHSHRGFKSRNNHNFNNTRNWGGYQNRNDYVSFRNFNSRRGGHRSTEYNGSDNYLNNQRNKYNFENGSIRQNNRSNHDSSAVAKRQSDDRNNGLNGTHDSQCFDNEQNSRIRENVKFSDVSSGTSSRSYSEVVKRRL